jgi:hypothetical protein
LTLTGDESLELTEMARADKTFPHDPTSDQFLPPDVFEAYTALGQHIAEQVDGFFPGVVASEYGLGECWGGPRSSSPSVPTSKSSENSQPSDALEHTAKPNHNDFTDRVFEKAEIESAIQGLYDWCELELEKPSGSLDEDYLMAMSQWARDNAASAKLSPRKKLCVGLSEVVDRHAAKLAEHTSAKIEFYNMLAMLGDQVPEARQTMKKLSGVNTIA